MMVFTASSDHSVACWSADKCRLEKVFNGHAGPVTCLVTVNEEDNDQIAVVSGSLDETARLWDMVRLG